VKEEKDREEEAGVRKALKLENRFLSSSGP
jgi:hypothetical protein